MKACVRAITQAFAFVLLSFCLGFGQSAIQSTIPDSLQRPAAKLQERSDSAQQLSSPSAPQDSPVRWYTMIENLPRDWSRWGEISFGNDKLGEWAAVSALTAVLIATDDGTYTPSKEFYESTASRKYWSDFFAEFGDGRTQFALAGTFAAYGLLFDDQKAWRTGSQIVEVVLASGGVVQVLKHITGRESPIVRSRPLGRWSFFPNQVDYHRFVPYYDAFPSGHICTSLATVIVIAENYPDVKWVRPVGYTLTALVGIGMANNGIHWYSDYPLGLFFGYYFGMIAAHPEGFALENPTTSSTVKMSLLPTINSNGAGFFFTVRF